MNWKQNDWAHLLLIAEFAYNNTKNTNTSHTCFELNCGFHQQVFFRDNVDPCSRSHSANKLVKELKELIDICQQNLLYAQEPQKRVYDKSVKLQSYTQGEKV